MPAIDDRVTVLEVKVEQMVNDARDHFSELREFIVDQVTPLKTELSALHQRLDRIDKRLDSHDERFTRFDGRLDRIDKRLDSHDERFDRIDWKLDQVLLILARR